MTSHEYARKLAAVADLLAAAPEFEMPSYMDSYIQSYGIDTIRFHNGKDRFLAAARAIGNGEKIYDGDTFEFHVLSGLLRLTVDRDAVCRIVKPAVPAEYECEPLLSQEEVEQI